VVVHDVGEAAVVAPPVDLGDGPQDPADVAAGGARSNVTDAVASLASMRKGRDAGFAVHPAEARASPSPRHRAAGSKLDDYLVRRQLRR